MSSSSLVSASTSPLLTWALQQQQRSSGTNTSTTPAIPLNSCWKWQDADGDANAITTLTASKVRGLPYLSPTESWPTCPKCTKPQWFAFQLCSSSFPLVLSSVFGTDWLFQHWECLNCVNWHNPQTNFPYAGYYPRVRRIPTSHQNQQHNDYKEHNNNKATATATATASTLDTGAESSIDTLSSSSSSLVAAGVPTWASYECNQIDDDTAELSYLIELGQIEQDRPHVRQDIRYFFQSP